IKECFRNYDIQSRIALVVYNSHNQFQQTNVLDEYMSEGIGGVTELFKNRVVIPFEGSYEQFRHVIHHELVHGVMNDYMYGGSIQGIISGRIRVQVPLWVAEGLAEYSSRYGAFNTQSDMFVRDAVMEAYLPPLNQMGGYAVYTAGPTVFRYMEEKYGREKVAEFMTKLRVAGTPNATFESTFGMKEEEFSDKWATYQRKIYYPDISQMVSVKEIGKALTNHLKDENFYNMTPTISPNGDKIAYLTDKSGYADIMLISAYDGMPLKKLVSGEKTPNLEELHWLSPGMSWSPDSKKLVFAAKASDNDALLVVDVMTGDITKYSWPDLEGVFGGSWSPDGKKIVFSGMRFGQSDVFEFELASGKLSKLTDDVFSDSRAVYSRDGSKIAFVSDRRDILGKQPDGFKMINFEYRQTDIYVMNADGSGMERITTDEMNDSWPEWGPDNSKLLFTSDRNGVSNIYVADLKEKKNYAITNNLSGIFQPSLSKDGKFLTFSGFNRSGFDVYTLKNPFEMKPVELPITISMKKFRKDHDLPETLADEIGIKKQQNIVSSNEGESSTVTDPKADSLKTQESKVSYRNFVFAGLEDENNNSSVKDEDEPEEAVELPENVYKNEKGDYRVRRYRVKFSPDMVYGTAGFNTLTGFQGVTQFAFSDMLGDHRLLLGTNLFFDLKNSSFTGSYYYLANRTDYGITAFHSAYAFATDYLDERIDINGNPVFFNGQDGYPDSFVRFRFYGLGLNASRPINKFNRIDFSATQLVLARETSWNARNDSLPPKNSTGLGRSRQSNNTVLTLSLINDNSLNTYFGPFDGQRAQVAITASPGYGQNGLRFVTATVDGRKYFWFKKFYAIATRASFGATFGRNPQRFFVGGLDNWILPRFNNGDILVDTFEDFLATYVSPLRGSNYYELQGTRYFISNFEFRFPLVHFMQLGFPIPMFLQQIRGVTFVDFGAAWGGEDREFVVDQLTGETKKANYRYIDRNGNIVYNKSRFDWGQTLKGEGNPVFQDARIGYGFGIRAFVGFFILRYDLA
ncbi:MAG TPA: hypothetical protein PLC94_11105, partial [bacterium]|nr:hypothetical protein [bacterium]